MPAWISDRRLYVDRPPGDPAAVVVEEGDPRAAYLLAPEGGELDEADARRYGLLQETPDGHALEAEEQAQKAGPQDQVAGAAEGDAVPEGSASPQPAPPDGKALTAPPAHKAVAAPPATKRRR
jgi:hypothetical protein